MVRIPDDVLARLKAEARPSAGLRPTLDPMTAAHQHPDLHELVDQLSPAQADAVRAVVLQLVTHEPAAAETEAAPRKRRELAFAAIGATKHGITTTMEQALADGFGRD